MVRQLGLPVALLGLAALLLGAALGCAAQENADGAAMAPGELSKRRAEIVKDDGVKPPDSSATDAPGAVGTPGMGANTGSNPGANPGAAER